MPSQYFYVGRHENAVVGRRPAQKGLSDRLQFIRIAQPVFDRLFGEAGVAHPICPQPTPPCSGRGISKGPVGTGDGDVLESGLLGQPEKRGSHHGVVPIPGGDVEVELHPTVEERIVRSPSETTEVTIAYGQQTANPQDPSHLGQRRDRVGQVLKHLVGMDDIEREILVLEGKEIADFKADVGQTQPASVVLRLREDFGCRIHADHHPRSHQLGQISRDGAGPTADIEQGESGTEVGNEVCRRVVRGAPGMTPQYRLVVPVHVGHANIVPVPELPEMQALAERLDALVSGRSLTRADLLGFSSLKTFTPPGEEVYGHVLESVVRRAKYLVLGFGGGLRIVVHLSQAGRLDVEVPPKRTRPRGAVARFTFGDDLSLLVREFGTQRKASWWILAKGDDGPLAGLGPEPDSPEFAALIRTGASSRRLHTDLRDQHVVAGIGRGWGDDILHRARLSPFASLGSLNADERSRLLESTTNVLAEALTVERRRTGGLSEARLGGRFAVHGRFDAPCPSPGCGALLRRVSFESYEMTYCAPCQTGGKVLADRRLSRLLK